MFTWARILSGGEPKPHLALTLGARLQMLRGSLAYMNSPRTIGSQQE